MRTAMLAALLPACTGDAVPDALAPRVDACEGGGGRIEAIGTLGVDVDGEALSPWRAEVLVVPVGDQRVEVETFACVLSEGVQVATWSVVFQLPLRTDGALALVATEDLAADGFRGTLRRRVDGDVDDFRLGDDATATITAFDATVGELSGTLDAIAIGGEDAEAFETATIDARLDLAW